MTTCVSLNLFCKEIKHIQNTIKKLCIYKKVDTFKLNFLWCLSKCSFLFTIINYVHENGVCHL